MPRRLRDFADAVMRTWQCFRAGIEGTISGLTRAFGLSRCFFRGFRGFASAVGLGVFSHNLIAPAKQGLTDERTYRNTRSRASRCGDRLRAIRANQRDPAMIPPRMPLKHATGLATPTRPSLAAIKQQHPQQGLLTNLPRLQRRILRLLNLKPEDYGH
jgi:hypothetical protein